MKKFMKIFFACLFVAALVGTFVFLWNKTRPKKIVYAIETSVRDTIRQYVVANGKVEPRDEVLIKPQISGIISDVACNAGDKVRQGQVIATVKVIPEMGALNSAESRVSVARISLDQVRREFDRADTLFRSGVITREEYEQTETSLRKAEEELRNAQDNLEIVQNGVTSRNADLGNTQIRSTIEGTILDIPIKVGNSVIQSNTFNDGTTIASVADLTKMLFRGNVDETDVGKLHEGMEVELTIGALQGEKFRARLEYISPKAKEENGVVMFEVKAAVEMDRDIFVRAGYSANASICVQNREGVITIQESTVSFEESESYVYVLTSPEEAEEQTFEKRAVKLGLSDGIKVEVLEGLAEGEKIRGIQQQL